jgi:hypothetical protein
MFVQKETDGEFDINPNYDNFNVKNVSVKDIMKKTKVITSSSDRFNTYLNNFYSSIPISPAKKILVQNQSEMITLPAISTKTEDFNNTNSNFNSYSYSNSNAFFFEQKLMRMHNSLGNSSNFRNAKIKNNSLDSQFPSVGVVSAANANSTSLINNTGINFIENSLELIKRQKVFKLIRNTKLVEGANNQALNSAVQMKNIFDIFQLNNFDKEEINLNQLNYEGENASKDFIQKVIEKIEDLKNLLSQKENLSMHNLHYRNGAIHMDLKSIRIEFDPQINENENLSKLEFYLPFDLLVLFLQSDFKDSVLILSQILLFKENELGEIILNYDKLFTLINKYEGFKKDNFTAKMNKNFNNFDEVYEFDWYIGKEQMCYKVKVFPPEIGLTIGGDKNITIVKNPNRDFLFKLIFNKYSNWEKETIQFLNSNKLFRNIITNCFSKGGFDKVKVHRIKHKIFKIDKENKIIKNCEKNKQFVFVYSNEEFKNHFVSFNGYYIILKTKKKGEEFKLSMNESKLLSQMSLNWNLNYCVKKSIRFDHKLKPKIDFNCLSQIDQKFISFSQNCQNYSQSFDMIKNVDAQIM